MKIKSTNLKQYTGSKDSVHIGLIKEDTSNKRKRLIKCISISTDDEGKYWAAWQYILRKTFKPSNTSEIFLTEL